MKRIIAILFILSLLATTSCKKKDDEGPTNPIPLKLSDRVGVYTGSITVNNGNTTFYSIVEVKVNGEILVNATTSPNPTPLSGIPSSFNTNSEETFFRIELQSDIFDINFISKTKLTLKLPVDDIDTCTLTKQ